ncbi:putative transporter SEO1 [Cytospora mali]|uniref:Transporter SEO1 n=1 Tax=Cytospora mali TaxID=578113 RepID=A0A194VRB1_CYTMA|nr:putative transporter SEO1 [Valsa mali]
MSPASNSRDRRASGGPEDDDEALETQGLLDQDRQTSSSNLDEQLRPSSNAAVTTMGFKDLIQRVSYFKRHDARSPLERDLVRRLDIFLMTFGCISQIIKYLDQTNISSAYVSGMKEDLGLYGNELNYFTTWFSVSYCIMLIPSQVIMTWVKPSWWLPGLEIGWGIMTGLIALCQNAKQVYVLRVFLGLFESSAWPGMMTLFMYWYTPSELAKRMALYQSCQSMGSMLSGALQTAMLNTLDGRHGIAGWRWLFIVNAIMTVVVGFAGFFMLPDYPSRPNPRAFWFNAQHARMAQERLERHGRAEVKKITWKAAKRTSRMWVSYFIPILYIATVLAQYGYNYFNLFLKSLKNPDGSPTWSTSQVNTIPIAGGAINVAFVWFWAILSDMFQTRWTLLVAQAVIGLVPAITMTAYASYFISYLCLGTAPLIMSWLSDLLPQDPEARTLILGYAIAGVYAIIAWSQVLVWPASEAPYYKHAWQVSIALWILVIFMTVFLRVVDVRFLLPKRLAARAPVIEAVKSNDDDVVVVDASGGPVNPKRTEIEAVA